MLHTLRVLFLVILAGILVQAVMRVGSGTTGLAEDSIVALVGCLWIVAAWSELRQLRLGMLGRKAH
jgi:hypothetical protein